MLVPFCALLSFVTMVSCHALFMFPAPRLDSDTLLKQ